ncbi:MAG: hypothetical protein K2Z81_17030, partial [Cyanobacteria bacterium]|nr:hypothetical protein [Cyanobacteriota bacterium]
MKLRKKCIIFLVVILSLQVFVFSILALSVFHKTKELHGLRSSGISRVITSGLLLNNEIVECSFCLLLSDDSGVAQAGNRASEGRRAENQRRFAALDADMQRQLQVLKEYKAVSTEDKADIEIIIKRATFVADQFSQLRKTRDNLTKLDRTIKVARDEAVPYNRDILEALARIEQRHLSLARTARDARQELRNFIISCFLVNVAITFLLVIAIQRGVVNRISAVANNISRKSRNKNLRPLKGGTDELFLLEKMFHELAEHVDEAAQKERIVFANIPAGLLTLNSNGVIES